MDILWLQQNSVSRQFLANAISTLSEQLITINNVVNGFVCTTDDSNSGDDDDDDDGRDGTDSSSSDDGYDNGQSSNTTTTNAVIHTKCDPTTDTQINRSNETIFTKTLINSIRGNVACAHRYRFNGGGNDGGGGGTNNYQYQSRKHKDFIQSSSRQQHPQLSQRLCAGEVSQYHEQKLQPQPQSPQSPQQRRHQQQQAFPQHLSLSSSPHLAWTTATTAATTTTKEDIKAIGVSVNLDMKKKCGTISTYDCDSNYNTTATTATTKTYTFHSNYGPSIKNKFWAQHDVKNDSCNYIDNNYNNNNKNNGNDNSRNNQNHSSTRSTPLTVMPFGMDSENTIPSNSGNSNSNSSSINSCRNNNNANFFERLNIDSSSFNQMPLFAHTKASIHAQSQYDKHGSQISSRNQWWKKLVIVICYLFLLSSSLRFCSANKHEVSNCTFPQRWEGSWFLSGNQQPISIKGNTLSFRGKCMASDGDKFLIVDEKGCHRCLVIYEKHKNVLQYKESECEGDNMFMDQSNPAAMSIQQMRSTILKSDHKGGAHPNIRLLSSSDQYSSRSNDDTNDNYYCKGRETLQNLCEQIAGDALLYSLFKENAEPVKCPLRGPFTFTYNRGHGECKNPVSNIESCTEDSRLLLNLQACPDVAGTESTVEELTCLATWRDGNSRYLVGLVSHHHAVSNEERYRCFVYEKILSNDETSKDAEYKLAQSGDATCNGLDSAEVGSRIMTLRRSPPTERCDFPAWFKGPQEWRSLIGSKYHQSDGSMHITKSNGHMETRALCEQINKNTATETQVIVHQTTGCQSGYMCMIFYRRDTHIAEIQMGLPAARLEDACTVDNFDILKLPYVTLVASTVDPQECPLNGLYNLRGAIGPPYISSRHKRNHNKGHHHHHEAQYKRFTALSFRNPEEISNWQVRSRLAPLRNRRDVRTKRLSNGTIIEISNSSSQVILPTNGTEVKQTSSNSTAIDMQRMKRETPECVINYNSMRQLFVGCSQSNVIEVKPHCSEDGDEVYNCEGSWTDNNATTFIVAKHLGSHHSVCISYQPIDASSVRLFVGDTCYRSIPIQTSDHHLAANLTIVGKCTDVSSASKAIINWNLLHIILLFTINALIACR